MSKLSTAMCVEYSQPNLEGEDEPYRWEYFHESRASMAYSLYRMGIEAGVTMRIFKLVEVGSEDTDE